MFVSIYLVTASGTILSDVGQLRIEVAKAIIERFDVTVPAGMGITGVDGRDYSWFGIGSVLLALPLYAAGKFAGTSPESAVAIMNQLVAAATVLLIYFFVIALGYTRRTSVAVSIFYGLATFSWYYAKEDGDHIVETFFTLLSVYYMFRYVTEKRMRFLLQTSAASGMAFLSRPSSVLIIPPLLLLQGLYIVKKENCWAGLQLIVQNAFLLLLACLPFLGIACWYNYARFGTLFETGYTLMAERLGLEFFSGTALLRGLAGFLVSPGKGFFFYSPIAILFFFSIRSFARKQQGAAASFILIIMSYLLFLSKNVYWHGDWAWGPRYLLVITPYLIIPTAAILDSNTWQMRRFIRMGVHSLFGISLIIQLIAISVNHNKYFIYLQSEKGVKFTVARGSKVQPIIEPPESTYFTWSMSPILAQTRFIREFIGNLKTYVYTAPPDNAPYYEKAKAIPAMNVFDFWWLYKYYVDGDKAGFVAAGALFLWAFYCAAKLWKYVI